MLLNLNTKAKTNEYRSEVMMSQNLILGNYKPGWHIQKKQAEKFQLAKNQAVSVNLVWR